METSYVFKQIIMFLSMQTLMQGEPQKKHASPVMTKSSSWENFSFFWQSIPSFPASAILKFLSLNPSLWQ